MPDDRVRARVAYLLRTKDWVPKMVEASIRAASGPLLTEAQDLSPEQSGGSGDLLGKRAASPTMEMPPRRKNPPMRRERRSCMITLPVVMPPSPSARKGHWPSSFLQRCSDPVGRYAVVGRRGSFPWARGAKRGGPWSLRGSRLLCLVDQNPRSFPPWLSRCLVTPP